jgi:hypothetical protein
MKTPATRFASVSFAAKLSAMPMIPAEASQAVTPMCQARKRN